MNDLLGIFLDPAPVLRYVVQKESKPLTPLLLLLVVVVVVPISLLLPVCFPCAEDVCIESMLLHTAVANAWRITLGSSLKVGKVLSFTCIRGSCEV